MAMDYSGLSERFLEEAVVQEKRREDERLVVVYEHGIDSTQAKELVANVTEEMDCKNTVYAYRRESTMSWYEDTSGDPCMMYLEPLSLSSEK
jgi:hypothetical protein